MPTPPGRYDETRSLPRPALIALAVLALLAVTALSAWAFQRSREGQVDQVLVGYEVVSDRSITITFEVHKDDQVTALCRVQALGEHGDPVGEQDVTLGPDADRRVTATVATRARAYSGVVAGCREEPAAR
jgi:hypothetical protein